jgi:hypothetical protein
MHGTSSVLAASVQNKKKSSLILFSRKTFSAGINAFRSNPTQNRPYLDGMALGMLRLTGGQSECGHIGFDFTE